MCGIAGVYNQENASIVAYHMLCRLKKRGRDGAGIYTNDGQPHVYRNLGVVQKVFDNGRLLPGYLKGRSAVGQVRYATSGDAGDPEKLQPLRFRFLGKRFGLAHNGNIPDYAQRLKILDAERHFEMKEIDTELFPHEMMDSGEMDPVRALLAACAELRLSFSLIVAIDDDRMVAVCDPLGNRPLCYARCGSGYLIASESCAFSPFKDVGEVVRVQAGTAVIFEDGGPRTVHYARANRPEAACSFEGYYLASPTSLVFGMHVADYRRRAGELLAAEETVKADLVVPVPESACFSARAYARALGLPCEEALVKNDDERTFIAATPELRQQMIEDKMDVIGHWLFEKTIALVDDSVVRGSSSIAYIRLIMEKGKARAVHMRSTSPHVYRGCDLGVATFDKELIASPGKTDAQIAQQIGAATIQYLSMESHKRLVGEFLPRGACDACFGGKHPAEGLKIERLF